MHIGIVGINHKSAGIAFREQVAKACQRLFREDTSLLPHCHVLLSTCNRTEIYFSCEDIVQKHSGLLSFLRQEVHIPFEHYLYSYFGEECFFHLARVTAGLDSALVAETEIQRQVKEAYQYAAVQGSLPSSLHFLFQKCLKIGKAARTRFPFKQREVSMEKILFSLVRALFGQKIPTILFVGNSEINRKILFFFEKKIHTECALCTRAVWQAKESLQGRNVHIFSWDHLHTWQEYDCVILGTRHGEHLLTPEQLGNALLKTRLLIDLSVPRSVHPQLGRHPQLTLMNIDQLGLLIEKKQRGYKEEIHHVQEFVREAAKRQFARLHYKSEFGMSWKAGERDHIADVRHAR